MWTLSVRINPVFEEDQLKLDAAMTSLKFERDEIDTESIYDRCFSFTHDKKYQIENTYEYLICQLDKHKLNRVVEKSITEN